MPQEFPVNDDLAHHPASLPPEFPRYGTSVIQRAERLSQRLYCPSRGVSSVESNVLVSFMHQQVESDDDDDDDGSSNHRMSLTDETATRTPPPSRAYWIQRTIRNAIYGRVRFGIVLKRRVASSNSSSLEDVEWEVTSEFCAIKEMDWSRIRQGRGQLTEDPIKEVKALQYLKINSDSGAQRPQHVLVPLDLLGDSRYMYLIQPFCDGGELFNLLESSEGNQFSEQEARFWMKQILLGLDELQRLGICHRDLSLENIMIHNQRSLVIDFGMCICVPFDDDVDNEQQQQQQQQGSRRRRRRLLVAPQGTCGKWHYMAPEIVANQDPFDGFAIDLWAAGVILFIMLLGYPPWERAQDTDERFRYMSRGYMTQLLTQWNCGLSPEAMDLLQKMLYKDPQHRLSLRQVCSHPWFRMEDNTTTTV